MKIKVCLASCLLAISSIALLGADKPKQPPQMSAQEKAEMDAMTKAATPGGEHKKLAEMIGTWAASVKMWNAPGAPPATSSGTAKNTSVLGGRFIEEDFSGNFMGQPFSGRGYTGYDNVTKQYVGTWMDTWSTGVMTSTGKADSANTYSYNATMSDPMSGKAASSAIKITVMGKDKHVMEMWAPGRDGKQYKMMEITYTRKK